MKFEVLKGTKDFLPKEQIRVNEVLDVIRNGFESYGFRPLDTPVIEYFDTLSMKYDETAEIVQEIFKVTERLDLDTIWQLHFADLLLRIINL